MDERLERVEALEQRLMRQESGLLRAMGDPQECQEGIRQVFRFNRRLQEYATALHMALESGEEHPGFSQAEIEGIKRDMDGYMALLYGQDWREGLQRKAGT